MDSDMVMIGVGVVAAIVAVGFALFSVFRGVHGNLANARVGEVYNFDYEQPLHGESKRVLARVIEPVYTLDKSSINAMNRRSYYRRNDPSFKRTEHLVTCEMPNGDVRNFYAERAKNVRRSPITVRLFTNVAAAIL